MELMGPDVDIVEFELLGVLADIQKWKEQHPEVEE